MNEGNHLKEKPKGNRFKQSPLYVQFNYTRTDL